MITSFNHLIDVRRLHRSTIGDVHHIIIPPTFETVAVNHLLLYRISETFFFIPIDRVLHNLFPLNNTNNSDTQTTRAMAPSKTPYFFPPFLSSNN